MPADIHILSTAALRLVPGTLPEHLRLHTLPFIETTAAINANTAQRIAALATQPAQVIFTSVHAVRAVTSLLHAIPDWDIYCIEGPTSRAVTAFFGNEHVKGTAHYGAELAAQLLEAETAADWIFFCGNKRLDTIPGALEKQGRSCEELIVYETKLTPQHVPGTYDGILFFSPSGVESFFSCNALPVATVLFAIGTTTAAALTAHCNNKIITAHVPEKSALLDTAIAYFNTNTLAIK